MKKFWRFEFYIESKDFPYEFEYLRPICNCHIFTIGKFGFTFLSKECYNNTNVDTE